MESNCCGKSRADEALANMRVLILSASDSKNINAEARALTIFTGFLNKPIRKEELLATLEAVLRPSCG